MCRSALLRRYSFISVSTESYSYACSLGAQPTNHCASQRLHALIVESLSDQTMVVSGHPQAKHCERLERWNAKVRFRGYRLLIRPSVQNLPSAQGVAGIVHSTIRKSRLKDRFLT